MRWLWRQVQRLLILLLIILIGFAAPVAYTETLCRGNATAAPGTGLSSETRPEIRTLLTYPEWHIVHAYDEYAEVIRTGDPHDFGLIRAVAGYWSSLGTLTRESAALGEIDVATKQRVYVIGVSFTFEMLMKASYEETLGRFAALIRGETRAPLDDLSAQQSARYARFLQQVPWYRYDFHADAAALTANLPDGVAITGSSPISVTLQADSPDLIADVYQVGAWLVLPARLEACIPASLRDRRSGD